MILALLGSGGFWRERVGETIWVLPSVPTYLVSLPNPPSPMRVSSVDVMGLVRE